MKKGLLLVIIFVTMTVTVFSQSAKYDFIINRKDIPHTQKMLEKALQTVPKNPNTTEDRLRKAYLLFGYARVNMDIKVTTEAYEYFQTIYKEDPKLKNPMMEAYIGSAHALVGRDIKGVGKKIRNLNNGVAEIDEAIERLKKEGDSYAVGFGYFLRLSVISSAPAFLKVTRSAPDNFKSALKYYGEVEIKKENGDVVAELFGTYAEYYLTRGKKTQAKKNYEEAVKQAYSPEIKSYFQMKLDELR